MQCCSSVIAKDANSHNRRQRSLTRLAGGSASSSIAAAPLGTGPAARAAATALSIVDLASSLSRVNLKHDYCQHQGRIACLHS